jgi:hypothetical protein
VEVGASVGPAGMGDGGEEGIVCSASDKQAHYVLRWGV